MAEELKAYNLMKGDSEEKRSLKRIADGENLNRDIEYAHRPVDQAYNPGDAKATVSNVHKSSVSGKLAHQSAGVVMEYDGEYMRNRIDEVKAANNEN